MLDEQEVQKPFCGPHRLLQSYELLKNVIYLLTGTLCIWTSDDELIDYNYVYAQTCFVLTAVFNMFFYFYRHVDSSFEFKMILWASNTIISVVFVFNMGVVLLKQCINTRD
jgi:hypothetical protein